MLARVTAKKQDMKPEPEPRSEPDDLGDAKQVTN